MTEEIKSVKIEVIGYREDPETDEKSPVYGGLLHGFPEELGSNG